VALATTQLAHRFQREAFAPIFDAFAQRGEQSVIGHAIDLHVIGLV
jgi:hypothetical protein